MKREEVINIYIETFMKVITKHEVNTFLQNFKGEPFSTCSCIAQAPRDLSEKKT